MHNSSSVAFILITKGDSFGGASRYVLIICKAIASRFRIRPIVLFGPGGTFVNVLKENGIECIQISSLGNSFNLYEDICSLLEIVRAIRLFKPRILLLNSGKAGLVGRFASLITNVPAIFVVHGWSFVGWHHKPFRCLSYFVELFMGYVCTSFPYIFVSKWDRSIAPCRKSLLYKSRLIYNGAKALNHPRLSLEQKSKLREDSLRRSLSSPRLFTFLSVCRLDSQKDVASLVRAVSLLPDCNLVVVGDGKLRNSLESLVVSLIMTRIFFAA